MHIITLDIYNATVIHIIYKKIYLPLNIGFKQYLAF